MKEVLETNKFYKIGGNLSLDFVNTLAAENGLPKELLEDFSDLAVWAQAMNLVNEREAKSLIEIWRNKSEAKAILNRAVEFRKLLLEMAQTIERGATTPKRIIDAINALLRERNGYDELWLGAEEMVEKRFRADFSNPVQILASVAMSAADLLVYGNPKFLRKCGGEGCVLYFYDQTKNHSRRWCSMQACGNRAKAAAFYQRGKMKSIKQTKKSDLENKKGVT